jgi:hypothetical protein
MAVERKKEKSRGFADFGIPIGSTLVYKKDPAITVKTLDGKNKVEYQGKPYSISTLAKQLAGSPVSGYLYFKYRGKTIKSLARAEAMPSGTERTAAVPPVSADPAETAGFGGETAGADIDPLAGTEAEENPAACEAGEEE